MFLGQLIMFPEMFMVLHWGKKDSFMKLIKLLLSERFSLTLVFF